VFSQLRTSAVNVTLLAFATERNSLLCAVLRQRYCWAPGGSRSRSISVDQSISIAGTALSSKPAAAADR